MRVVVKFLWLAVTWFGVGSGALLPATTAGAVAYSAETADQCKNIVLSIGINHYRHISALKRAQYDADDVRTHFERQGFCVIETHGANDKQTLSRKINQFLDALQPGSVALFFFAGHGLQHLGSNYLVPSDMTQPPFGRGKDVVLRQLDNEAINLQQLLQDFAIRRKAIQEAAKEAQSKNSSREDNASNDVLGIFIIDACRELPFKSDGTSRGLVARAGLVPVRDTGGAFVLYSAGTGELALDSLGASDPDSRNSVFMRHFRVLISEEHHLSLTGIAQRLKVLVSETAQQYRGGHDQMPAFYSGLRWPRTIYGEKAAFAGVDRTRYTTAFLRAANTELAENYERSQAIRAQEMQQTRLQDQASGSSTTRGSTINPTVWDKCSFCPELVAIAPGRFTMGDAATGTASVNIDRYFAISRTEITYGQWMACVNSSVEPRCDAVDPGYRINVPEAGRSCNDSATVMDECRLPMRYVNWEQAKVYTEWLSSVTEQTYHLPTEAEWEFSARAGSTGKFSFSRKGMPEAEELQRLCDYGNGADRGLQLWLFAGLKCDGVNGGDIRSEGPSEAGSLLYNRFGLHDVHGNVWEWVQDCWNNTHNDHPGNNVARAGPGNNSSDCKRVVRGGSWMSEPDALRSASRTAFSQLHARQTVGFRVVRKMPQPNQQ